MAYLNEKPVLSLASLYLSHISLVKYFPIKQVFPGGKTGNPVKLSGVFKCLPILTSAAPLAAGATCYWAAALGYSGCGWNDWPPGGGEEFYDEPNWPPVLLGLIFLGAAFLTAISVPVVWNFLKSSLLTEASTHWETLSDTASKLGHKPDISFEKMS